MPYHTILCPFMPFHTISCHILIIWGKFLVLITIICYPKIRWSLNSLTGGCCPYDSQSSTEQISIMLAFFNRKFSWDPFLNVVFFGMSFFLVCRLFWYVVFFGMSFFLVGRFFWYVVFFGMSFFFCPYWVYKDREDRHYFSLPLSLRRSTPCKKWNYQRSLKT